MVNRKYLDRKSTDGSVVEFSPATREARVRFPVSALFLRFFLDCCQLHVSEYNMNALLIPFLLFLTFYRVVQLPETSPNQNNDGGKGTITTVT